MTKKYLLRFQKYVRPFGAVKILEGYKFWKCHKFWIHKIWLVLILESKNIGNVYGTLFSFYFYFGISKNQIL